MPTSISTAIFEALAACLGLTRDDIAPLPRR